MTRKPLFLVSLALGLLALAGCNEMKLALHVVKRMTLETEETEPLPAAAEEEGYKLGEPYEIDHVWYFPSYDANYDQTGVASWYGHPFHGRPTANGERYDMNDVTAAHPTLPLPSRTPSATATSYDLASSAAASAAALNSPRAENGRTAAGGSRSHGFLVEAAALEQRDDAERLSAVVRSLGTVAVQPERRSGRVVYAVRIGPVDSDDEAATILAQLNQAGHTESHIIAAGYR